MAAAVVTLLAIVAFAVIRETTTAARGLTPPPTRPVATPSRPAFTPAEEAYIRALWPIHGDVEQSTVRLSLGQIFYKINDMDRTKLKARADEALATSGRKRASVLSSRRRPCGMSTKSISPPSPFSPVGHGSTQDVRRRPR